MSIDDIPVPSVLTVDTWRSVLHDVIDEVLDQILLTAESARYGEDDDFDDEWLPDDEDDEPPGDPPAAPEIADLSESLRAGLATAIERGVAVWGCDGTLRCTRAFVEQVLDSADPVVDEYRRLGVLCDCAVLAVVLGRTDASPRCASGSGSHQS